MQPSARVVVCDDEPITRMDLREMLQEAGYTVVGDVGDGVSAIQLCKSLRPDVLVLDIKMPGMDGISVAKALAGEEGVYSPAVVLVTAYHQRDLAEDAASALVDAYLLKPIAEEQLVATLEVALARRQGMRKMQERIEDLGRKLRGRKLIDKARGILMARKNWNEEQAYAALRSASMNLRLPLESVAEIVIAGRDTDRIIDAFAGTGEPRTRSPRTSRAYPNPSFRSPGSPSGAGG